MRAFENDRGAEFSGYIPQHTDLIGIHFRHGFARQARHFACVGRKNRRRFSFEQYFRPLRNGRQTVAVN